MHFNASGEGKRSETDGHNTDIKARRESAMRAGEPAACVTPDAEAQAQLHSGGIPGSYPVVLDFEYHNQVKVGSWEGILSFHDFQLHKNGDVTAWKSYGIGPGKRFTKEFLDKKYTLVNDEPRLFPQGPTGATFKTLLAAESFVPKFERSKRRKRERDVEKDEKRAARTKRCIEKEQEAQTNLQAVKDERAANKCLGCRTGFKRKSDLAKHVCTPIADATNNDNDDVKKTEPFKTSNTIPLITECNPPLPLMGHGLVTHRYQNYMSNAVKNLLEIEFLKGVTNSGDRKGVLEMVETCLKKLPVLAVPSIQAVSSWLASRLKRDPQLNSTSQQEDRSKPKSESEGQQTRAGTLSVPHFAMVKDSKGAHLFLAKYRDVLLVKDNVTRIITSVQFDETRSVWTVNAARANIHKYDSRIYKVDTETPCVIPIDVGRGNGAVGPFIKAYNNS
jgi:hypothetical protein